jgi:transposase, IS30 family
MKNEKYIRLTWAEREKISQGIYAVEKNNDIALRLGRHPSTIGREIKKQIKRKRWCYSAIKGQEIAKENNTKKGRKKKIFKNEELRNYIHKKLIKKWSPEEIAKRLKLDYPNNMSMRISHESIYQYIYCLPKGELKKELMAGLRKERRLRISRKAAHLRKPGIKDIISISERPEEVKDRIIPGHWEGDLIVGKMHNSAIGTLVERTTRLTLIVPLKSKDSLEVAKSFALAFKRIPKQFVKTLTYDRGTEMTRHKEFTKETKIKVYFADPHSPWQRGTNENTNGLIRQYFPKKTDFSKISSSEIRRAEQELNSRPRKVLEFYTPSEKFYELITNKKIALET